jgi:ABC-2 type transport system permease protein
MILTLVHIELEKLFRSKRSYIGLLAIVLIILVIEGGIMLQGEALIDLISENLRDVFILQGNLLNGYLISFLSINALWLHVPILVVIVTADLISGEAGSGTIRLILSRPVSRSKLILAKFITAIIYTTLLVLLLAVLSLVLGILFFGKGDIFVIYGSINILQEEILPGRFIMAFSFGVLGMWLVASLSFVFSALAENSLSPILLTMSIIILFTVISSFEIGIFENLKPYLFTTHMSNWRYFFSYKLEWAKIMQSGLILFAHIVFFISLTLIIFGKKDITS